MPLPIRPHRDHSRDHLSGPCSARLVNRCNVNAPLRRVSFSPPPHTLFVFPQYTQRFDQNWSSLDKILGIPFKRPIFCVEIWIRIDLLRIMEIPFVPYHYTIPPPYFLFTSINQWWITLGSHSWVWLPDWWLRDCEIPSHPVSFCKPYQKPPSSGVT